MKREIRYDRGHDRLVYVARNPDQSYWEGLWDAMLTKAQIEQGDRFVTSETRKHLPPGSKIIDAGCGIGATVFGLKRAGFDAYGIDFAEKTVAATKSICPDLDIRVGDVREMPFQDGYFDGLWSLGVIEHFTEGYDRLIEEAHRVIRPGGFLFLTVPTISSLKKIKLRTGRYKDVNESDWNDFFQFSFHAEDTIANISGAGFSLRDSFGRSGSFGFYEDMGQVSRWMLPSPDSTALPARILWRGADLMLRPFSFHTKYFLFQKRVAER